MEHSLFEGNNKVLFFPPTHTIFIGIRGNHILFIPLQPSLVIVPPFHILSRSPFVRHVAHLLNIRFTYFHSPVLLRISRRVECIWRFQSTLPPLLWGQKFWLSDGGKQPSVWCLNIWTQNICSNGSKDN